MATIDQQPITLVHNAEQWKIYKSRWNNYKILAGDPIRFPCLVQATGYYGSSSWVVEFTFAYEEILIGLRKAKKQKDKVQSNG